MGCEWRTFPESYILVPEIKVLYTRLSHLFMRLSHGMCNELTRSKVLVEEAKKGLSWERTVSFSQKEVSLGMISNPGIEVQTTSETRFSVPSWLAEVVISAGYLEQKGLLKAFAQQVRLVRGHFGTYEPIDFLALLIGYAISGERTLADFFERVAPFATAFMALFGRKSLPHRSSLSRFLADCQRCALREQCLASGAKGDRARRVSAARRLLPPPPPVAVERKPILLGPIRWVDGG
jgi:hypothetical protein